MNKQTEGRYVTETTIKSKFEEYRSGITANDPTPIVDVGSAEVCAAAYQPAATRATKPALAPNARIEVRVLTNADTDIKLIPVLFNSLGGSGRKLTEITAVRTGTRDANGYYLAYAEAFDVGADDLVHLFISDKGAATQIAIETRPD